MTFEHDVTHEITVPLCRACWFHRRFAGIVLGLLIVVVGLGLGMYWLSRAPKATRIGWVAAYVVWFGVVVWYIRNRHSRWMDRLFAGISAGRLGTDGRFPLWLKRSELAEQMTYQAEPRKYLDHVSYATHEERAVQQFASWWGKCLLGSVFLLAGSWVLWELTKLEAGRNPQISLPALLILIHDFVGKWAASCALAVPGVLLFGWAVWQFLDEKRA